MSKESMVFRDLFASVCSGTSVNATLTSTDLLRSTITESPTYTFYSTTAYTYDISGYTVSSGVSGAVYTPFYCNGPVGPFTGTTLQVLSTGNTIVYSYISGGTSVPTGTTITETAIATSATATTYTNYLNVNIDGGSPTFANLFVTGDLTVSGNTYQVDEYISDEMYIGAKDTANSWRFVQSGADLLVQTYSGGTYVTKSTFLGA